MTRRKEPALGDALDMLVRDWARLGAGFSAPEAEEAPDLERTLLQTARLAPSMARVFVLAITWMTRYGDLIAIRRLGDLIRSELEPAFLPTMGLMLELAEGERLSGHLAALAKGLPAAAEADPLFEVERGSPTLMERARRRASAVSVRWGVWCEPVEVKDDALRPRAWVLARNPELRIRATPLPPN